MDQESLKQAILQLKKEKNAVILGKLNRLIGINELKYILNKFDLLEKTDILEKISILVYFNALLRRFYGYS